jgi:ABC-2 type transport system ATP-binding protein
MEQPIERPVFGFAVSTIDGMEVTAPSSRDVDCVPEKLAGTGQVDINFESMMLLPGTYDLTVSLYDYGRVHAYDVRREVLRFDVERGSIKETSGVVSLRGRWQVSPAGDN